MTKIITAAIIIVVLWVAYHMWVYWEQVRDDKEAQVAASKVVVREESLSGMPSQLENSLQGAKKAGLSTFRKWLETYGPAIQDPRKAWIELDYCMLLARENPKEAGRIFAGVKNRTPTNSPVYFRIKELQPTYEH
jgi:hypothetical protein